MEISTATGRDGIGARLSWAGLQLPRRIEREVELLAATTYPEPEQHRERAVFTHFAAERYLGLSTTNFADSALGRAGLMGAEAGARIYRREQRGSDFGSFLFGMAQALLFGSRIAAAGERMLQERREVME